MSVLARTSQVSNRAGVPSTTTAAYDRYSYTYIPSYTYDLCLIWSKSCIWFSRPSTSQRANSRRSVHRYFFLLVIFCKQPKPSPWSHRFSARDLSLEMVFVSVAHSHYSLLVLQLEVIIKIIRSSCERGDFGTYSNSKLFDYGYAGKAVLMNRVPLNLQILLGHIANRLGSVLRIRNKKCCRRTVFQRKQSAKQTKWSFGSLISSNGCTSSEPPFHV